MSSTNETPTATERGPSPYRASTCHPSSETRSVNQPCHGRGHEGRFRSVRQPVEPEEPKKRRSRLAVGHQPRRPMGLFEPSLLATRFVTLLLPEVRLVLVVAGRKLQDGGGCVLDHVCAETGRVERTTERQRSFGRQGVEPVWHTGRQLREGHAQHLLRASDRRPVIHQILRAHQVDTLVAEDKRDCTVGVCAHPDRVITLGGVAPHRREKIAEGEGSDSGEQSSTGEQTARRSRQIHGCLDPVRRPDLRRASPPRIWARTGIG